MSNNLQSSFCRKEDTLVKKIHVKCKVAKEEIIIPASSIITYDISGQASRGPCQLASLPGRRLIQECIFNFEIYYYVLERLLR